METPKPKTTQGVPWADHNETESNPPDPRRDEDGNEAAELSADERASEPTRGTERESFEDEAEREQE